MKRVLNLDPQYFSIEGINILKKYYSYTEMNISDLNLDDLQQYNIVIVKFALKFDKTILAKCKKLEIIACPATGVDHIDKKYCDKKGITIISLFGESTFLQSIHSSAEHTWALLISVFKNISSSSEYLKSEKIWDRNKFITRDLFGKTLGIIGYGRNGKKIAKFALAFGMNVVYFDKAKFKGTNVKNIKKTTLIDLVKYSDLIVLSITFNNTTKGIINKKVLDQCINKPIIVNSSRGEVIVEEDIIYALENGKISKYATDVLTGEYDSNFLNESLLFNYSLKHKNVLITPHIAGANFDSWEKADLFICKKIIEVDIQKN